MKRKALFNRIISLSIVAVLSLTSSASAFADAIEEDVPAVETTAETSEEAAFSDAPATDENIATENPGAEENTGATENAQATENLKGAAEGQKDGSTTVGEVIEEIVDALKEALTKDPENPEANSEDPENPEASEDEKKPEDEEGALEEEKEEEKEAEEELEKKFEYVSNGDGSHTVKCPDDEEFEEYIESCEYDEHGVCIHCGFERLPDPILTYEDEEVIVSVSGAIPEKADLKVTPIKKEVEETSEQFDDVAKTIFENEDISSFGTLAFIAYDICFISIETNEEVEPDGDVTVSMEYKKQINPLGDENKDKIENIDVSLVHINKEDSTVENISDEEKAVLEVDSDKLIKKAEFTNDTFSPYVFVYRGTYNTEDINLYFDSINKDGDNLVNIQDEVSKNFSITRDANRSDPVEQFKDNIEGFRFVEAGYMVDGQIIKFDNFRYTFKSESSWSRTYYYPSLQLYLGDTRVAGDISFDSQQIIIYMFYEKDVALSISKIATGPPASDTGTEYEFKLTAADGSPVARKSYKNGNTSYRTDNDGKFKLKAGESADFSSFDAGDYIITELGVTGEAGYTINDFKTKIFVDGEQSAEYAPESTAVRKADFSVAESKLTEIKVKNFYYTKITESQKEAVASKYVRYYEDKDDYQVQLKFTGPEIVKKETSYEKEVQNELTSKNVHVVFAVDRSSSMADNKRALHMQQASKIMAEIIKTKKHVNAEWKIVDFGGSATASENWLSTDSFYDTVKTTDFAWYYPGTTIDGGTNYQAGLNSIKSILDADTSDAQKIVIFLTDGLPTVWNNNSGNPTGQTGVDFSTTAYNNALSVAATLKPDGFYSIGLDFNTSTFRYNGVARNAAWFLSNLTTTTKATNKSSSTVTGNKLVDLFKSLAGVISETESGEEIENTVAYHAEDVLISDPLSDYVDIEDGTTIYIGIRDENVPISEDNPDANELKTLGKGTWRNGIIDKNSGVINNHDDTSINIAEYDIYDTDANGNNVTYTVSAYYDKESRSVKMTYPDNYELPANYSFTVSFMIVPSEKAKDEYFTNLQNNSQLYNAVGDPFTDHISVPEEKWTSSGKDGFYSNGDAKVMYEFCGNSVEDDFPHPVIQVHLKTVWEVYKTDGDGEAGERLANAVFTLTENGGNAITGTSRVEDIKPGLVVWNGDASAGKTYILKETTAPFGYVKSDDLWQIALDADNKPTIKTSCSYKENGEIVVGEEYVVEPVREDNNIVYKFYFKNLQTYTLPETGGGGIYKTTLYGILLMLASVFLFYRDKRKSRVIGK